MAKTVAKISYSKASVGFNMRRFRLGLSTSGHLGLSFTDVARVIVERACLPLKNGGSMAGNGSFEREKRKKKKKGYDIYGSRGLIWPKDAQF